MLTETDASHPLTIACNATDTVGFASERCGIPVVFEIEIRNHSASPTDAATMEIRIEPAIARTRLSVPAITPGARHTIARPDISLRADTLRRMAERTPASLELDIFTNDQTLGRHVQKIDILAFNEWDRRGLPEMLAAFVLPNDPAVAALLDRTRTLLEEATGNPAIDGYQSKSRGRARALIESVFRAIQQANITYIEPPASFEASGQKIRLPEAVMAARMGTCIDISLLAAAALEQCGLHPIIILQKGHAFPGAWLVDDRLPVAAGDSISTIRKLISAGDLVVFDSSTSVARPPAPFARACAVAGRHVEREADFQYAIDVVAARRLHILPLPIGSDEGLFSSQRGDAAAAPADGSPPPSDHEYPPAAAAPRRGDRLDTWRGKLLDLTLRNRLIHYKPGAKSVALDAPELEDLEDLFITKEKFTIEPAVVSSGTDPREAALMATRVAPDVAASTRRKLLEKGRVASRHNEKDLSDRLLTMYRTARLELQESGASTLNLALGFVRWHEDDTDTKGHLAPILLYPVEIERRRASLHFEIRLRNDEPRLNETLLEKLKLDFHLDFTELREVPRDDAGIDVRRVMDILGRALARVPRFEVIREAHIAFFSFQKYIMWRDLDAARAMVASHGFVSTLAGRAGILQQQPFPDPATLDQDFPPSRNRLILDADSSQHAAVAAALNGCSFVLQGPPGTGKSQTITNMIAECIAAGRRVLFVAEKRAALDVVARRLHEAGLGSACLELHSNKANKRDVVLDLATTLDEALAAADPVAPAEFTKTEGVLSKLSHHRDAMHQLSPMGFSLYGALNRLAALAAAKKIPLTFGARDAMTGDLLTKQIQQLTALAAPAAAVGHLADHPLRALRIHEWSPLRESDARAKIKNAASAAATLQELSRSSATAFRAPAPETAGGVDELRQLLELMAQAPEGAVRILSRADGDAVVRRLQHLANVLEQLQSIRTSLQSVFRTNIFEIEIEPILVDYKQYAGSFSLIRWFQLRRANAILRKEAVAPLPAPDRLIPLLDQVLRARQLTREATADQPLLESILGAASRGVATPVELLRSLILFMTRWRTAAGSAAIPVDAFRRGAAAAEAAKSLQNAQAAFHMAFGACITLLSADVERLLPPQAPGAGSGTRTVSACDHLLSLQQIRDLLELWDAGLPGARDWAAYIRAEDAALEAGLRPFVELLRSGAASPATAAQDYEKSYLQHWVDTTVDGNSLFSTFDGRVSDRLVEEFCNLDANTLKQSGARIRDQIRSGIRRAAAGLESEVQLLRRESVKKTRHLPVRALLERMPELAAVLKPCFLMSPLSIAQYLPPGGHVANGSRPFDIIIFDEASQIPTEDAIGAICRGKTVVIVGDRKQLPPTSFFQRDTAAGDEINDEPDRIHEVESILEECVACNIPEMSLSWHYRSRDERLITFSNYHYYNNKLQTFPGPVSADSTAGVEFKKIDGVFDRGKSATNPIEAAALADHVTTRLLDPKHQGTSIGIVTFNLQQQQLIEDLLDQKRREHPEIEPFFDDAQREPVFIKNLESVQGDERDHIYFSTGFGPDAAGRVTMNFGPLNREGGERRLNVAVTRAREKLIVFSSMTYDQIDPSRTRATGALHLREFLRYAALGPAALGIQESSAVKGRSIQSIEDELASLLAARGFSVTQSLGCSNYKIDIAVADPARPKQHVLAIEFDGLYYNSGHTTRERERLRRAVLSRLGWKVLRVWMLDYYFSKERELDRICKVLSGVAKS